MSSRGHSSLCLRKSGARSLFAASSSQEEHTPGCWKLQISLAVFLQHPTLGFSATFETARFAANQAEDSAHTERMNVLVLHLGEKQNTTCLLKSRCTVKWLLSQSTGIERRER